MPCNPGGPWTPCPMQTQHMKTKTDSQTEFRSGKNRNAICSVRTQTLDMHVLPSISPVTRHRSVTILLTHTGKEADGFSHRGSHQTAGFVIRNNSEQRAQNVFWISCGKVTFRIIHRTVKNKTLNITSQPVAVTIYLVSFEPDLSLLSRNPNVTLMWEDGTSGQREKQLEDIRVDGKSLFPQQHCSFFRRQYLSHTTMTPKKHKL